MKKLKVKTTEDGDAFLDLQDFADILDISKVVKYKLEEIIDIETEGTCLCLTFYDKKGKVIQPKDVK